MQRRIQSLLNKIIQYWVYLSISLLLIISFLSLRPITIDLTHHSDKVGHLLAYGILIFPAALRKPRYLLWIFISFSLWSGILEILQNHVDRHGYWLDWLANTLGLSMGSAVAFYIKSSGLYRRN